MSGGAHIFAGDMVCPWLCRVLNDVRVDELVGLHRVLHNVLPDQGGVGIAALVALARRHDAVGRLAHVDQAGVLRVVVVHHLARVHKVIALLAKLHGRVAVIFVRHP